MLSDRVKQLFSDQLIEWELAKNNYIALAGVKLKTLDVGGCLHKVQFNPARIISSSANVDTASISQRKCFLCKENLPAQQKSIPFGERYLVLVNPYPIFPRHLTIPDVEHTPQNIASRFGDMLDLAQQLDDYTVFYNGPKCGASAPDHFHFQAGNKGFLPIENSSNWKNAIRFASQNKEEMNARFRQIYDSLPHQPNESEPMMNIIAWYEKNIWTCCLFPRKKHRPDCYFADGDANMLISPASVDLGGVFVMPLEKDFEKITAKDIADVLNEIVYFNKS